MGRLDLADFCDRTPKLSDYGRHFCRSDTLVISGLSYCTAAQAGLVAINVLIRPTSEPRRIKAIHRPPRIRHNDGGDLWASGAGHRHHAARS